MLYVHTCHTTVIPLSAPPLSAVSEVRRASCENGLFELKLYDFSLGLNVCFFGSRSLFGIVIYDVLHE